MVGAYNIIILLGGLVFTIILLLSFFSGLRLLSDVIEENYSTTKICLRYGIYFTISLHIFFWLFDRVSILHIAFGIGVNIAYMKVLPYYPDVQLKSPQFISAMGGLVLNHFNWLWYLQGRPKILSHLDVLSFFEMFVWIVPLVLFISINVESTTTVMVPSGDIILLLMMVVEDKDGSFSISNTNKKQRIKKTKFTYKFRQLIDFFNIFDVSPKNSGALLPSSSTPTTPSAAI